MREAHYPAATLSPSTSRRVQCWFSANRMMAFPRTPAATNDRFERPSTPSAGRYMCARSPPFRMVGRRANAELCRGAA